MRRVPIYLFDSGSGGLGKLLRVRMESHPQSEEWKQADAALTRISETKNKRVPSDRHKSRMSALYVEPISEHRWNRPAETSSVFAEQFLQDAVNDYSGRYHNGYSKSTFAIMKDFEPELYNALEQWSDRPELQLPEWPGLLVPYG
jgi:hypothetical protein